MKKFRNISPAEYTYLGRDNGIESPFVNQFFVEGKGKLSKEQLKQAVHLAHQKNPAISLTLKGRWAWRYWAENKNPPEVFEYNGDWQGNNSNSSNVINVPFNPREDVLASVCLFSNIKSNDDIDFKILFRVHHALCDGAGTLHWIKEVFRALRNEIPEGSAYQLNELDIIQREDYPAAENLFIDSKPIFPSASHPDLRGCHWIKCRWQGKDSKILAKLIFILKELTEQEHGQCITTFRIPSDLRRYLSKEEKLTAQLSNLTGLFDLRIENGSDVDQIQHEIIKAMRAKKDISVYPKKLTSFTKYLPNYFFKPKEKFLTDMHAQGLCKITGMISYVGKPNLADYSCENFKANGVYAIPMPLEDKSVYIGLFTDEKGILAVLSVPNALSTMEQTQVLADEIEKRLALL